MAWRTRTALDATSYPTICNTSKTNPQVSQELCSKFIFMITFHLAFCMLALKNAGHLLQYPMFSLTQQ